MKLKILAFLLNFLSIDMIAKALAYCIAALLKLARKHSSEKGWQTTKKIIKNLRVWADLFDQVYADDELTEEEEAVIADAIKNCTTTQSIYKLLKEKTNPTTSEIYDAAAKKN